MHVKTAILVAPIVLAMVSCSVVRFEQARQREELCVAPNYGIYADEHYKIIALEQGSNAEKTGLQVGDVLVAAAWVKMDLTLSCNDALIVNANGSPLPTPEHVIEPAQMIEPKHPAGLVPFTDQTGIAAILDYRPIIKLQIQRGDQIIEFVIAPGYYPHDYSKGTPTPAPTNYKYF